MCLFFGEQISAREVSRVHIHPEDCDELWIRCDLGPRRDGRWKKQISADQRNHGPDVFQGENYRRKLQKSKQFIHVNTCEYIVHNRCET